MARTTSPDEIELFARGRQILGVRGGGLIVRLLRAKEGNIALARAALDDAAGKFNPREYLAACCRHLPTQKGIRGDDWW